MSRSFVIATVALAAYALLDIGLSTIVAIVWRTRAVASTILPPAVRARRLLVLRLAPGVIGAAITLAVVTPAFVIFEPAGAGEQIGPALAALAIVTLLQLGASLVTAARNAWLTARIERTWLRGSRPLPEGAAIGMRAFAIESASPMIALVGVFAPKLIAAHSVVDACTAGEMAAIVGHERGHLTAHDNLKRWVMASLPDLLRWTPIHHEMVDAWHHAAEDAADDAATGGEMMARAELAALLLKVVRLAPSPAWHAAIASPFVETDGLERRVRRLLQPDLEPPAPVAVVPLLCLSAIAAAIVGTLASPATLRSIFEAFERLVALGR
jgi:Zn-dependent protease with chaperone function